MALVFEQNGSYETSTIASGKARGDDSNGLRQRHLKFESATGSVIILESLASPKNSPTKALSTRCNGPVANTMQIELCPELKIASKINGGAGTLKELPPRRPT
jgi:hypothetical protein